MIANMKNYEDRIRTAFPDAPGGKGGATAAVRSLSGDAFEVNFEELLDMIFDGRISEAEFGSLMSTAQEDFFTEKQPRKMVFGVESRMEEVELDQYQQSVVRWLLDQK